MINTITIYCTNSAARGEGATTAHAMSKFLKSLKEVEKITFDFPEMTGFEREDKMSISLCGIIRHCAMNGIEVEVKTEY